MHPTNLEDSLHPSPRGGNLPTRDSSLTYVLPPDPSEGGGVGLSMLWDVLKRRRWTILLCTLPIFAGVAIYTAFMPEVYESSASILVEPGGRQEDSPLDPLGQVGKNNSTQTEIQLLTSRRVAEPVARQLHLQVSVETDDGNVRPDQVFSSFDAEDSLPPGTYRLERGSDGRWVARDDETDQVVGRQESSQDGVIRFAGLEVGLPKAASSPLLVHVAPLSGATSAAQGRYWAGTVSEEANLVVVHCSDVTPRGAKELCDAVTEAYLTLRANLQRAEATAAASFLEGQVGEVGKRLAVAEDSLAIYQKRNQAVALNEQASVEVQQYANLKAQEEQLLSERRVINKLLEETSQGDGSHQYGDLASFPTFLKTQNQVVGSLVQTLVQLQNRRSELAVTRTAKNPDMAAVDQRIEEIEGQLQSFATSYEKSLDVQISSLQSALGSSRGQLSGIPELQIETARLTRQVALLEDLYGFLQKRLREAEVAKMVDLPGVRVVDTASTPGGPSSPDVPMNLALGLVLGLGFGLVVAFYREYTDDPLRDRKEVERETGIPVLGMIPNLRHPGPIMPIALPSPNGHELAGNGGKNGGKSRGKNGSKDLTKRTKKAVDQEIVLEAFRSLAADLRFAGEKFDTSTIRSLAVTSSGRGDGKTFVSCNLAIAMTSRGIDTVLVDADLRASGVSRFFDLAWTSEGLSDVLLSRAPLEHVYRRVDVDGEQVLNIISSGKPTPRTTGILDMHTVEMRALVGRLESAHQLVIVDTPPLNVLTDAATIASRVDAVLVVVRGGVTDRDALELTMQRLARANARVVGMVLNDVDLPQHYAAYSHAYAGEEG